MDQAIGKSKKKVVLIFFDYRVSAHIRWCQLDAFVFLLLGAYKDSIVVDDFFIQSAALNGDCDMGKH